MIDLDLSIISNKGKKMGWDAEYRSIAECDLQQHLVLFSGDVTAAPKPLGASELFFVTNVGEFSYIMFVNFYNRRAVDVPYKLLIANEQPKDELSAEYMVDLNNIVLLTQSTIAGMNPYKIIATITKENDKNMVVTLNQSLFGRSITSINNPYVQYARDYILESQKCLLTFNKVINLLKIELISNPAEADIDLSLTKITKETFVKLLN